LKSFRFSGRAAVVCALVLAIGVPATAVGFGEGRNLLLGKRNPSSNSALGLSSETQIIANNSTYGTRQSNKKDGDGGGAIYGCRSSLGNEPCIRSANLKGGRAFEFVTVGNEAGRIETGSPTGAPFTTNATGVATGLNADKVDGKSATDFASASDVKTLADGLLSAIVTDPGGSVTPAVSGRGAAKVAKGTSGADTTYTVTFGRDVSKCSSTASPTGVATGTAPGVAPTTGDVNSVTVNVGVAAAQPFNLQVIC
jgi:hypothetical protein